MNAIFKYRLDHKLTQEQLAEQLGISKASVCRFESGVRKPSVKRVDKITELTGIPRHELRPDVWEAA
jgi:transcriptional regulator with XRE-family HTH domain